MSPNQNLIKVHQANSYDNETLFMFFDESKMG